ncbi:MAG: M23 family metallopeptidase [Cyanobacteria bacterium P01_H01_bin.58]
MRFRLPQPYTILITRTGETPIAIKLRPLPMMIAGLIALSVPSTWATTWVVKLIGQNEELTEQNQDLTETAGEVLTELESLDHELDTLRERAGLSEENLPVNDAQVEPSQGGPSRAASAEDLFSLAKAWMPKLTASLESSVRPALESTLAEESARAAAFPNAKPFRGNLETSSEFGLRPNPFGGRRYEMHSGIDFRGSIGTPIQATAEGVVTTAKYAGGYGKYVVIDHGYDHSTLYAHLSAINVEVGDRVKRGDIIGELGNTGRSTGPHLHYEIRREGTAIDPRQYLKLNDKPSGDR